MSKLRLRATVGRSYNVEPDDILQIKAALQDLGIYQAPPHGLTPFSDREMFEAIERFQGARGLNRRRRKAGG